MRSNNTILALSLILFVQNARAQFAAVHELFKSVVTVEAHGQRVLDMDKDGDKDIVIFTTTQTLALLRNDGDGHFSKPDIIAENVVELVDFNKDSLPDVIEKCTDNSLCWRQNKGDGTFENQFPINAPYVGQIVDVNNDGELDIFYSVLSSDGLILNFNWLENEGSGVFGTQHTLLSAYQFGSYLDIRAAQMIDLNADGLPDFVYTTLGFLSNFDIGHWFQQETDGTLSGVTHDLPGKYNGFRTYADLDQDGDVDMIDFVPDSFFRLQWLANDGDGNFSTPVILPLLTNAYFSIDDVNGDGAPDIIAASTNNRTFGWGMNDGNGAFTLQNINLNFQSEWLFDDLTGDGNGDFIFLHGYARNNGVDVFAPIESFTSEIGGVGTVATVMVNADSAPDIIFHDYTKREIGWLINDGKGQFPSKNILQTDVNGGLIVGDFNADGSQDLADANFDSLQQIWWGTPNGAFGTADSVVRDLEQAGIYQVKDVDADGDLDWQVTTPFFSQNFVNGWMLNDGAGNFSVPSHDPVYWTTRGVADIDGDSLPDLIAVQDTPTLRLVWFKNLSGSNFGPPSTISREYFASGVQNADFDNDGDMDLLLGISLPSHTLQSNLFWMENPGKDTIWAAHQVAQQANVNLICLGDFSGDGTPDVCIGIKGQSDTTLISWYKNDGNGNFTLPAFVALHPSVRQLAPADFDLDGDLDIFFSGETGLGWFENFGNTPSLRGICFWDANENGKQDSTETPLAGIKISLDPVGKTTFSAADGSFLFYSTPGNFQLTANGGDCFMQTKVPNNFSIQLPLPVSDSIFRFGFSNKNAPASMEATTLAGPTRCGFEVPIWVSLQNKGCKAAPALLAWRSNGLATFVGSDPMPLLVAGDSVVWKTTDSLQAGETRTFRTIVKVADASHLGDTLKLATYAWSIDAGGNPLEPPSSSVFASVINCAFDPNDKLVNRTLVPTAYDPVQHTLQYTLRFQNTGTDTAFNVRLLDTLTTALDWSTLRPLGASHSNRLFFDPQSGQLEFRFDDINLPDSSSNKLESNGLVAFSIQLKDGLSAGTDIRNRAAIYFDFNAPILTNTVETKVQMPLATSYLDQAWRPTLWPNPNPGIFTMELPEPAATELHIRIMDVTGRIVFRQMMQAGQRRRVIRLEDLPDGLYFLQVLSEGRILATEKLVKE